MYMSRDSIPGLVNSSARTLDGKQEVSELSVIMRDQLGASSLYTK